MISARIFRYEKNVSEFLFTVEAVSDTASLMVSIAAPALSTFTFTLAVISLILLIDSVIADIAVFIFFSLVLIVFEIRFKKSLRRINTIINNIPLVVKTQNAIKWATSLRVIYIMILLYRHLPGSGTAVMFV